MREKADLGLGFARSGFLAGPPNGRSTELTLDLFVPGAPTVPLDTSTPLDDYPAKPCGARPWMSASG
jgi:hypothetical protein